jgi:hypothetical protein
VEASDQLTRGLFQGVEIAWSVSTEEMVHSEQNVYTEYAHSRRTEWITKIHASAEEHKAKYVSEGLRKELSRIGIIELRAGRCRPQRKTQELQVAILKSLGKY